MGFMKDVALELEERGIPNEVYREASVSDALRLINDDSVSMVKVNGRWAIGKVIHVVEVPQQYSITVRVV